VARQGFTFLTLPHDFWKRNALNKTKKVAGVDLSASSFAFVGDLEKTETWALPIHVPGDRQKTVNLIKSAAFRVATAKIVPESQRQAVWLRIAGAAQAYGITVQQPAPVSAPPGGAHPETATTLDADEVGLREARALGSLYADRLLEKIEMKWGIK
jgi:hypothetical protein